MFVLFEDVPVTLLLQVDHFIVQPVFEKKNAELARAKRAEGNEAFQKKRYKQARKISFVVVLMKLQSGNEPVQHGVLQGTRR